MDPFDPDLLTPEERTREVGELLARGYLRRRALHASPTAAPPPPETPPSQPENDLDAPGDQSVHVGAGLA